MSVSNFFPNDKVKKLNKELKSYGFYLMKSINDEYGQSYMIISKNKHIVNRVWSIYDIEKFIYNLK